jgi:hypothetical protein
MPDLRDKAAPLITACRDTERRFTRSDAQARMRQRTPSLHAGAAPESTVGQAGGMPLIHVTYDGR